MHDNVLYHAEWEDLVWKLYTANQEVSMHGCMRRGGSIVSPGGISRLSMTIVCTTGMDLILAGGRMATCGIVAEPSDSLLWMLNASEWPVPTVQLALQHRLKRLLRHDPPGRRVLHDQRGGPHGRETCHFDSEHD